MINFKPGAGPYAHSNNSTTKIMYHVVLALLPACAFAAYSFGPSAVEIMLACVGSAIVFEFICLAIQRKPVLGCFDGSAVLTGLILAMCLPPKFPLLLCVLGTAFAIVIGKQAYGGLGQNLFNPAMLARVFLLICFPVEMTQWYEPMGEHVGSAAQWLEFDGVTSATILSLEVVPPATRDLILGHHSGSLGEMNAVLLILGGFYLIYKRVLNWVMPCCFVGALVTPAAVFSLISPDRFLGPGIHLYSGGAIMCAFFIVTDMVTSPSSYKGQALYAVLGGLLVWLIREFGNYPEGVAFAILIINSASPLIDHYVQPVRFGAEQKVKGEAQS